jgi:hypothetical protein
MGQIMFSRNPTGTIRLGLVIVVISAFLLSTLDPLFGPLAVACIAAGAAGAVLLARRRKKVVPHIDPRDPGNSEGPPPPIVPR